MKARYRFLLALGSWVLGQATVVGDPGSADSSPSLASEYSIDRWTSNDGLPQNTITSIAQTSDGYLWLGTFGGLVRFDGIRFTVFDAVNTPQLKSGRVRQLYVARSGALWIVSEFGEVTRLEAGVFTHFQEGLTPEGVSGLAEDKAGRLWAGSRGPGTVYRFQEPRFAEAIPLNPAQSIGSLFALVHDADGNLWAGRGTEVLRVHPEGPEYLSVREAGEPLKTLALGRARNGGIWLATSHGARNWHGDQWTEIRPSPRPIQTAACICEDERGYVWIGTWDQGILRFGAEGRFQHVTAADDPARGAIRADFGEVRAIFEDREANIWLGTGSGLFRLRRRIFQTLTVADGLPSNSIRAVTEDGEGNIWVGAGRVAILPRGRPEGLQVLRIPSQGVNQRGVNQRGQISSFINCLASLPPRRRGGINPGWHDRFALKCPMAGIM